jgi:hypothetical protein
MLFTAKNETAYQQRVCRLLGIGPAEAKTHQGALSPLLAGVWVLTDPPPVPAPSTDDDDADNAGNLERLYDIINTTPPADNQSTTVEPGHSEPPVHDRYW